MLEGAYNYWDIHANQPPHLDIQYIPLVFEGRFYPDIQFKAGRYYETGPLLSAEPTFSETLYFQKGHVWDYERATNYLRHNGMIKPYEWVGHPEYYSDRIEYIRYTPESYHKYRRLIPSIRAGFETMLAKKRVGVICRYHNIPEDCEQIIKEFLLPIPRNKVYHLHY